MLAPGGLSPVNAGGKCGKRRSRLGGRQAGVSSGRGVCLQCFWQSVNLVHPWLSI